MTGIIFLLILFVWISIAKQIPFLFIAGMKPGNKKLWVYRLLCLLCFLAPVADEVVGGMQFWVICQQGTQLKYNAEEIKGKKLKEGVGEPGTVLKNTILRIVESPDALVDFYTGKHLVEFSSFKATGGWLKRQIAFNGATTSFTCHSNDKIENLQDELGFILVTKKF